ncbi:MAG: DNA-methyltransferase [Thermomicrobiales bacterium]
MQTPELGYRDRIFEGDCSEILSLLPDSSIDLIVTSPPYADQRRHTYGGIHPDAYVDWFMPTAAQLKRVLKPTGSFVLNIKERVVSGERHTYVLELILAMRKQGWLWTEEYMWHKKNCYPGKWPNRFRDAWERCLHFTVQKDFAMYQESVMVPMGDWRNSRLRNLSETDKTRDNSRVESGFGKKVANWVGREYAYPTNVLHFATECGNRNHSAAFPVELPEWFIKLLTKPGDVVLDPFMGSGTTAVAARHLGRHFTGIELEPSYIAIAHERLKSVQQVPLPLESAPIEVAPKHVPDLGEIYGRQKDERRRTRKARA